LVLVKLHIFTPKKAKYYYEPATSLTLEHDKKFQTFANFLYRVPRFAQWNPPEVSIQFYFYNSARDQLNIKNDKELYDHFVSIKEGAGFAAIEKTVLSSGVWVHTNNIGREVYRKYYENGYVLMIETSYSDGASKKTRKKYSKYLKTIVDEIVTTKTIK